MHHVRNPVHRDFEWNRYLLFDLLGRNARPLRDDVDVIVCDIGISFHRKVVERDGAPGQQQYRDGQNDEAVVEREIDYLADHYCSTVACRTSAFDTTCCPGWIPETISCRPPGNISPPTTSIRRN